jgi:hypothetical protein
MQMKKRIFHTCEQTFYIIQVNIADTLFATQMTHYSSVSSTHIIYKGWYGLYETVYKEKRGLMPSLKIINKFFTNKVKAVKSNG